jgi:hypothetical protein
MRLIQRLAPIWALLAITLSPMVASADDTVDVRAILVSASREAGETDRSLAKYEANLRRILRFESYRQLGSGRGRAALPGQGSFGVGQGQTLNFRAEDTDNGRIRLQLEWRGGSRTFMRTGVVLRPGVPAVLGGPSQSNGDVYALIVIAN